MCGRAGRVLCALRVKFWFLPYCCGVEMVLYLRTVFFKVCEWGKGGGLLYQTGETGCNLFTCEQLIFWLFCSKCYTISNTRNFHTTCYCRGLKQYGQPSY